MLCNAGHRILRKCRSEKKLRHHHERKASVSSTTSSEDTLHHYHDSHDHSHEKLSPTDWDPLRLHPPLPPPIHGPRPVPVLLRTADADGPVDHWGRPIISRPPTRRPPPPAPTMTGTTMASIRSSAAPSILAHEDDGFDFGFTTHLAPPPSHIAFHVAGGQSKPKQRRPSTSASSTCSSDSNVSTAVPGAALDDHSSDEPSSPGRLRPRPALADSPGYLIKHGAWKRRGIVFVSEEARVGVTEDDCFDLP